MPPLPMTPSACDALGKRMSGRKAAREGDDELLQDLLDAYDDALQVVQDLLRDAGFNTTGRVKTLDTLTEKIRRGSSLKSIQDIAGARIVVRGGRIEQDETLRKMQAAVEAAGYTCKPVDRRINPMHGYRAVHLVVFLDGVPVEIQIRTELQDLWAQITESLGDRWGRELRYGEPVKNPDAPVVPDVEMTRKDLLKTLFEASEMIDSAESISAEIASHRLDYYGDYAEEIWATSAQLHRWDATIRTWLTSLKAVADVQEREQ